MFVNREPLLIGQGILAAGIPADDGYFVGGSINPDKVS